jgi:glycosyltransferase involved in cell wall biosynthesis
MPPDDRNEAAAPDEQVTRLAHELQAICAEASTAIADLQRLVTRYQEVQQDSAATQSRIAAIRASNSWRAITTLRQARARLGRAGAQGLGPVRARRRQVSRFVKTAPIGVNVAGYLDTESGMGEAARASIRSLDAAALPFALNNVASRLRKNDRTYAAGFGDANPHPFNLVHLNADNMGWFADGRGKSYFADRYTIGYWFWELSTFREEWVPFFGYVDEVWAASEFMRASFAAWSPVPVVRMPLPVVLPLIPPLGRSHFGLRDGVTAFLYIFDVSSQMERKNPSGAIRAFRQSGLTADDAVLVLKFTNAEYDRAAVARLHEEAADLPVVFLDGYMDRAEVFALMATCDCYVSPHRSEGFGLTMLESMRLGKAVIGTAYSGNMDFMSDDNSFPLPYRLTTLTRDYGPYMRGAEWAEPDLDEAARLMRLIHDQPDEARSRGHRAQEQIIRQRDPAATGAILRHRLEQIRSGDTSPASPA